MALIRFRDFLEMYGRYAWIRSLQMIGKLVRCERSESVHFSVGPKTAAMLRDGEFITEDMSQSSKTVQML